MEAQFHFRKFIFKQPSGTSRGILTEKLAWFIELKVDRFPNRKGIGECSVIPGLSPDFDSIDQYEQKLREACSQIHEITSLLQDGEAIFSSSWIQFPSILFGIETALLDLNSNEDGILFPSDFTQGKKKIAINGLIWMGDEAFMQQQIEEKLNAGFSCIKMKVGAIDFDTEWNLLKQIRSRFSAKDLILRVDANGAFSPQNALEKLTRLAELDIHSIEQPISAGQWEAMKQLCSETPLPIALDEELIGISSREQAEKILDEIQPQFIILKPSLHGGLVGSKRWIQLAEERSIPWWMTSALESNVGLNAIAQFTATYENHLPQGLGTGSSYVENTPTRLHLSGGWMAFLPK